jgi:hypothetical protein
MGDDKMAKTKGLEKLVIGLRKLVTSEHLEQVPCPIDKAHAQLIPETIQRASEIQRRRVKYPGDMIYYVFTGDGCVYNVEGGQPVFYFTNTALNPIFKQENIADAVRRIEESKNYKVKADDFSLIQREAAKDNGDARRYVLSDLGLTRFDDGAKGDTTSFYEINTENFDKLNEAQRALAEQVHGKGRRFRKTMKSLRKYGISKTKICVLNPEYVQSVAKDGPVARVGDLYGYLRYGIAYYSETSGNDTLNLNDYNFSAGEGRIGTFHDYIFGVPREAPKKPTSMATWG